MIERSPILPEVRVFRKGSCVPRASWVIFAVLATVVVLICERQWQYGQPTNIYRRGHDALNEGDDEIVIRESERLIQTAGNESQGRLLRGLMFARKGKLVESLAQLEQAVSDDTIVEARTTAAKCFYQLGQYVKAIGAAQCALTRDAYAIDARRWLAAAYYDLGAVSEAIVELKQISNEAKSDPRPDRLMGLIAKDSEDYLKAIDHYRESLRRDPRQPDREEILVELAESQIKLSFFAEAMIILRDCSRSAVVLTFEADCQNALGQSDQAVELLLEALNLDARNVPAKLALGKLYLDTGHADQAKIVLADAVRLAPANRQLHFQLAQALMQLGNPDQAAEERRRSEEIQSFEREFTDLHQAAMAQPADADVRFRLGELAGQLAKPELSIMWFRAALAIDPTHAAARTSLTQVNSALQRRPPMRTE